MSEMKLSEYLEIQKNGINPVAFSKEYFYYYTLPNFDEDKKVEIVQGADVGSNKFIAKNSSILISKLNPRIKRVWLLRNDEQFRSISSTEFVVVEPKETSHIDFLYYFLQSDPVYRKLESESVGTTNSHVRFKPNCLYKIEADFPPKTQQEKIAKILATIDRAIAHTEALIEKYQQIKAGLMHDLFTRGIGADGKMRPPREEAPELYQESAIGWIPKDWILTKADSLITGIDAGKSPECPDQPASADQWGVLKVSAVHPDGLKQTENKVVTKTQYQNSRLLVKEGDLLITRANTPELVGMICYVEQVDRKLLLSDKTLRLQVDANGIDKRFLYWVFQHPKIRNQIEIDATGSSGSMKNISQHNIRNLDIAIPNSLDEQVMIRIRLDSVFNRVRNDTFTRNKLEKQKFGLMHDLLTGEVPVNVDADADEVGHV
jgi:type I restriction enzyme S subunit